MKGHTPAERGFMKGLLGKGTEILQEEPVSPGRDDSTAHLIARKRPPLKRYNPEAGIHKPFGRCRTGQARPDYQNFNLFPKHFYCPGNSRRSLFYGGLPCILLHEVQKKFHTGRNDKKYSYSRRYWQMC